MTHYCFFQKGKQIVVLEKSSTDNATQLIAQGYEKQFEEMSASSEKKALARFADIRRRNQADYEDFLAGAATMPIIDGLRAVAGFIVGKK